jgi:PAS domain S-box-containing protein
MSEPTNGGRAQAFQALRDSEELHRATLSSISDAVFLTDDEGLFTFVCPNVDVIFGYVPDEVRGMTRISRLLGENLFDRADLAARGEIRNIEREVTSKTGERRSVLIHLKKVSIQGSTVLYTCRDVTERRHAEEELRAARLDLAHVSRLALVGELIASIAHEITQPLTSILTNASAGLRRLPSDASLDDAAELREIFVDIGSQGRRAGEVIERVRALAGKRPLERQALDMNAIATEIVTLVRGEAGRRGVTIRTDLAPTLPAIDADRVSLQQVMLNLMLNGMDAMDELEASERQLVVRTRQLADAVEVAVSDTGHGIPADRLPKLFEAFFTTRKEGLGLGLAIARSIVEAHGGRILAEDHRGRGATFRLTIPALPLH